MRLLPARPDKDGMIDLGGGARFHKDQIIKTEEGDVSLEKYLEEFAEDEEIAKAMRESCRIR